MTEAEVKELARVMAEALRSLAPPVIGGVSFPVSSVSARCCEGRCPCNADCGNKGGCGCNERCGCYKVEAFAGELTWIDDLSQLSQGQLKSILEVAPVIRKLRGAQLPGKSDTAR